MKGRRATPHKVDAPNTLQLKDEPKVSRKASKAPAAGSPGAESSTEEAKPVPPMETVVEEKEKKLSADLTPTSGKKVVSLKPTVDGAAGERPMDGKKRFKVTITFSERTYNALARLKRKKKGETAAGEGEMTEIEGQPGKAKKAKRRRGPHGRPKLKAVSEPSKSKGGSDNALLRYIGCREREWDKGDKIAALMATALTVLMIIFCFLSWIRVNWSYGEGGYSTVTNVKGVDLGIPVYAMIAVAAVGWLYMAFSAITGKALLNLDYGFVIIICGFIFIALFFVAVGSTERVIEAATKSATTISNYERQTLWTAYFTVFLGILFAFSGLARLSERKAVEEPEKESG
jgi:hypothetical protein